MILKLAPNRLQLDALEPYKVDGIVLAGYMRIVGTKLIERYEHKILNIHPLLPSFLAFMVINKPLTEA